ncbi:3248_t:CDS:1 [Funneliformis caledonium]|uniref:UDP-glucose 4-epimerase n=1 Tax=Funneliformis caledonium TaxID=1117310 RepID=A0A9N9DE40_9GLOM|nr:3248_t:CDS:1 [Funneliformis caledonium]
MKVLICGGAGYIGSHIVRELAALPDYEVVIVDNLSKGHVESIPKGVTFEEADICDKRSIEPVFEKHRPKAVMHFCASIEVGESVEDPLRYYENNVAGTIYLLQTMQKYDVKHFIFSSTAAIFGNPETTPIEDNDTTIPINPYGDTKLTVEKILNWCENAYDIKYVCLRYFNACGAHESGEIGEDHNPESHLIPLVLQVALGRRPQIKIYGDDYDTRDGTCIRDYIHVTDLAHAHIKALEYLMKENKSQKFNLGSGEGYSVKEVIEAARKVTGHPIPAVVEGRRPGDPAVLIAGSSRAEKILGWTRKYKNVKDIVATAWKYHQAFPHGFTGK